jgi:hypothetical protein
VTDTRTDLDIKYALPYAESCSSFNRVLKRRALSLSVRIKPLLKNVSLCHDQQVLVVRLVTKNLRANMLFLLCPVALVTSHFAHGLLAQGTAKQLDCFITLQSFRLS